MTDTQAGLLPEPSVRNLTDAELANMLGIIATILETAIGIQKSIKMGSAEYVREAAARLTSPSPPASAEVGAVLSCKASELQEYGCACRWEGMKLADICDAHKEALRQASGAAVQVPEGHVLISDEMNAFLHGAGPLKGVWFSEKHPHHSGTYWWRRFLPRSKTSTVAAPQKQVA